MKKLLLIVGLFAAGTAVQAQSKMYKPVKVDLALGYGFGNAKGMVFSLEPKYNIQDQIAVGLRMEGAILGGMEMEQDANGGMSSADISISAIASYLVTGEYYFSNNSFRPLAGLGTGVYSMGSVGVSADSDGSTIDENTVDVGTRFGLAPRIGFEVGHFRMGLEYNLITGQPKNFNRNYFSTKVGFFFGGGKR